MARLLECAERGQDDKTDVFFIGTVQVIDRGPETVQNVVV